MTNTASIASAAIEDAGCIDIHSHVVPIDLPRDPTGGRLDLWPRMQCDAGHLATLFAGKAGRKFDERSWLASKRIEHMDRHGIALQVLSPLPELLGYWFEPSATALLCQHTNDILSAMIDANPSRFAALGGLPMNDVSLAIKEAQRLQRLGFAGVEIGSNVNGVSPADACFADLFQALGEMNLAVFIHGIRPSTAGRLIGPEVMSPLIGIPGDTALCVASFIAGDVLGRCPRLRVGFSHGGGGIGSVIDRLQHVWSVMPELKAQIPRSPLEESRRYYYDMLTFSPDYTKYLIGKFGSQALFVGTDFPAGGLGLMDPVEFLRQLDLTEEDWTNVYRRTALRFLAQAR